jgi:pilus assembly protein CpaF
LIPEEQIFTELRDEISKCIDISKKYNDDEIMEIIEERIFHKGKTFYIGMAEKKELIVRTFNSLRRYDILQPLLDDRTISEIMINGINDVFIERRGAVTRENIRFESEDKLFSLIQSIVSKVNRTVNESSPVVDARLKDGSRINAVLPPVSLYGPVLTIRKFPEKPVDMKELIEFGSLTEEAASFLEHLVKAKYNIFISGGTGSGKTTFLNALSNYIPGQERIVTIEDSAELQIKGIINLIRLETRNVNTEGKGEITVRDLIRASLRMRPDRIIIGEVRGAEAIDMLQAMNTGHDGSLSTGHSNSPADMLSRLETMVLCGAQLPLEAIRQQIVSAIDIIVHLGIIRDLSRKTLEITEVTGIKEGIIRLNPLYLFIENSKSENNKVTGNLKRTGNKLINTGKLRMAGITEWIL